MRHTNQPLVNVHQYSKYFPSYVRNMMEILTKKKQLKPKDLSKNVSKVKLHESFAK